MNAETMKGAIESLLGNGVDLSSVRLIFSRDINNVTISYLITDLVFHTCENGNSLLFITQGVEPFYGEGING